MDQSSEISMMDGEGGSEEEREKFLVVPQNGMERGRDENVPLRGRKQIGIVAMVLVISLSGTSIKCSRF